MRSGINRLITLGVLLLAFLALTEAEFTCSTADDCIHGDECRGDECMCETYWKKPEGTKGPCNISTDPVCSDDSCGYGTCSIIDHKISCDCEQGASGDFCKTLDQNHCLKNGDEPVCENESTCTNLLNGYSCACVAGEHWAGKSCAEYSYFSVSVGQQVVFETEFTELSVSLLKDTPAWHSVLLLFYAEIDGDTKKVTVTGNPANNDLTLHVQDQTPVTKNVNGLFTPGTWRSIEAIFEDDDLVIKDNTVETHRMTLSTGSKGTKVVFGGCGWESEGVNCGGAKDDVYYNEFIGGVQNFTLDNIARGYESGDGGHTDLFTCEDITCVSPGGACTDSSIPHCMCNQGYGGATCSDSTQASFNGYNSSIELKHTYLGGAQQVVISFDAKIGESESIAYLAVISGQGFKTFKVLVNQKNFKVKVDGEEDQTCSSTLTADSKIVVKVAIDDQVHYCNGGTTPTTLYNELSVVLGYNDIVHQDNFQGCISNLAIDGQHLGLNSTGVVSNMIDYAQCVTNVLPDDPCTGSSAETCNERGECKLNTTDYSAYCICIKGFDGARCEIDQSRCDLEKPCGTEITNTCTDTADAPYYQCKCNDTIGWIEDKDSSEGTCVYDMCHTCKGSNNMLKCVAEMDTYKCTCKEGWQGEDCGAEAVKDKSNTQTTLIIVVVALLVLMVALISVIFTVRRCNRKNQGEGTYSPNKAELEMGATPPPKGDNIYKNSEVIENVNAESKLFETDDNSLHDTSYNIYNITADAENGQKEEENVYDVADEPTGPPPPPIDEPTAPPPLSTPLSTPVVEEEIAPPPPVVYETVSTPPPPPPPTNDLPEPPTPLNTTAAESPNVTMDNGNTGVKNVKVDIEECEECEDSNQLSII